MEGPCGLMNVTYRKLARQEDIRLFGEVIPGQLRAWTPESGDSGTIMVLGIKEYINDCASNLFLIEYLGENGIRGEIESFFFKLLTSPMDGQ
jgi:hypothetical protein